MASPNSSTSSWPKASCAPSTPSGSSVYPSWCCTTGSAASLADQLLTQRPGVDDDLAHHLVGDLEVVRVETGEHPGRQGAHECVEPLEDAVPVAGECAAGRPALGPQAVEQGVGVLRVEAQLT